MRRSPGQASVFFAFFSFCALGAATLIFFVEHRLSQLVVGGLGESFSTRVYGAPYPLGQGACPQPERLVERLTRLGYSPAPAAPQTPGQYLWQPPRLSVFLRGFRTPAAALPAGLYDLDWNGRCWEVAASTAPAPALEPELASELSGPRKIRRDPASSEEIPITLKQAAVAVEDRRFFHHWGIDLHAIARALLSNLSGRGVLQGGSTITQQLAKNLFLSPKRNLRRKLAEAALSMYLELRYSKDRIITLYLNHIYLGQDGPVSVAGAKAAAKFYFGRDLKDLDVAQSALLAGIIRSPHKYNPFREAVAARDRRDLVLKRMREEGYITDSQFLEARAEPLGLRAAPKSGERRDNDYYVAEVIRQLVPRYGEEAIFRNGLSIYTAMDPVLQHAAQKAVQQARPQGALVALDPQTGDILALSGGKDFGLSQFNRATQAQRQPGSAFKPFVYGAAVEAGVTAATTLLDQPRHYPRQADQSWDPRNYENVYMGTVTVRVALAHSLNAATLDLTGRVGIPAIMAFAQRLGVRSPLSANLGLALGDSEVNLLELTAAYAAFDNGGFRIGPRLVLGVTDAEGETLETAAVERTQACAPAVAYLITSLLEDVVNQGTARSLVSVFRLDRPAAGKTGTTNDGRDAWFIGYLPQLAAGVWVGDDFHKPLKATGARNAVPIWASFIASAAPDYAPQDFRQPQGLVRVVIDPASGMRARIGCPQRREELFIAGTEPRQDCPLHEGGIKGLFHRLFRRT